MKIRIDRQKCIGSANCSHWAPGVFDLDDEEGLAIVIDPRGDSPEQIRLAADGCPTGAITLNE